MLEVGDRLVVHFRNRAFKAGGNYGMHPHGFRYTKDNEGAHYLPAGAGAEVPPGGQFEYHWLADDDSGPGLGESELACVVVSLARQRATRDEPGAPRSHRDYAQRNGPHQMVLLGMLIASL